MQIDFATTILQVTMNPEILNRKGARKAQDIPENVLKHLHTGEIETVNLTEWLAIDHTKLIKAVFPGLGIDEQFTDQLSEAIMSQKKASAMNTTKLIGAQLYERYSKTDQLNRILEQLSSHSSDSIRCYAPFLIGLNARLTIQEKLSQSQGLVADKHFGVREVVWMALRPEIDKNLKESIDLLSGWTKSEDENTRRFTTEATRPRGVWCKHIETLKENPALAIPILDGLKSDPSKYVQDSVGNWLNDASKSKPEFVVQLCDQWLRDSASKATSKIVKRARRTIDKK